MSTDYTVNVDDNFHYMDAEHRYEHGVFETKDGIRLELRPDGSCVRAGVACTYGVNGGLFSPPVGSPSGRVQTHPNTKIMEANITKSVMNR